MSEDILMELVDKIVTDQGFRESALKDLNSALVKYGYSKRLTEEELSAIREFHAQCSGLSVVEVDQKLAGVIRNRKQGFFS